eukprot:3422177-Rhodomonas_salina.1
MTWLHLVGAVVDHSDKTCTFPHSRRQVLLHPRNPVHPPDPITPITTVLPGWITAAAPPPTTSASNTSRSTLLKPDTSRSTHLPGPSESKELFRVYKLQLKAAQDQYDAALEEAEAEAEATGAPPLRPPSRATLSSMNVFEHVECNSAPLFERAIAAMDDDDLCFAGVLYIRGQDASDIEISDLPFP